MSLLMDALKRAEANKQGATPAPTAPADTPALRLEPMTPTPGAPSPLPDLASHLATVDADLAATLISPPEPRPTPKAAAPQGRSDTSAQEAARNVFAAKNQAVPPSRRPLILLLVGLGIATVGIGGYFWYQLQTLGQGNLARPAPLPATVPLPAPEPRPAAAPVTTPPVASLKVPVPTPEPQPSFPAEAPVGERQAQLPPPPRAPEAAAPRPAQETPAEAPIRLTRSHPEADPALTRAYQQLQAGRLDEARRDYEQALRRDPKHVDALLGLAAVAQRQGRSEEAARLQQLASEADPKDGAAQAAQIGATAASDPSQAESRLKGALAAQPESAPLHFALGNLYARQGRWADAQQAYFNAVVSEGDNPDYLFNLAVSLDHIRQPGPAANYYRKALEAAGQRSPAFNREQARKRLNELQPPRSEP